MRVRRSIPLLWNAIAFCICLLQAITSSQASQPPKETIRISLLEEFDLLHPYMSKSDASDWLSGFVHRPLIYIDANRMLKSHLLEQLPDPEIIRRESLPETSMQIKLSFKKNAAWADGRPVTGDDLLYTMELLQKEFPDVMSNPPWSKLSKISVNPNKKSEFTLYFRTYTWENIYSLQKLWILPAHIERPLFSQTQISQKSYEALSPFYNNPTEPGLYHGPWIIKEFVRGKMITLEKNPGYLPAPRFSTIQIKLVPHWGDIENQIKDNSTDMVASPGLSTELFHRMKNQVQNLRLPYTLLSTPGTSWEHLDFQTRNHPMESPLLRKAMIMSLDKKKLAEKIWGEHATYTSQFIHPQDPWYSPPPPQCEELAYNPESATKIFEALGYQKTKKGLINQKSGETLTILFMSNHESLARKKTATEIKKQWEVFGIDTKIRLIPGKIFFQDVLRKASFPGTALYAWKKPFPFNPFETFDPMAIPDQRNGFNGQNLTGWVDKQIESLLKLFKNEWNFSKQKLINDRIVRRFCEESPSISLWFQPVFTIIHKRMVNVRNAGYTFPSPYSSESWDQKTVP